MKTLEAFKQHIQNLGYTQNSINMIYRGVKEFSEQYPYNARNIGTEQINEHYSYLQSRPNKRKNAPLSEITISHHMYSLKLFFAWLEQTDQIVQNPMSNLTFKSPAPNPRQPLTQPDIQALFNAAKNLKEKTILHLFYSCGLRREEALNLNISDIDFNRNLLYVREGKGAKRRVIPINRAVKTDLENYSKNYRNNYSGNAFIQGLKAERMSGGNYNRILKQISVKAGLTETHCSPHYLRHSIATHLLENGMSIESVKEFLGHEQLDTTQIYTKVSNKQLKKL